jgi:hypothetical protein
VRSDLFFSQRSRIRVGKEFGLVNLVSAALEGVADAIPPLVSYHHLPQLLLACKGSNRRDLCPV